MASPASPAFNGHSTRREQTAAARFILGHGDVYPGRVRDGLVVVRHDQCNGRIAPQFHAVRPFALQIGPRPGVGVVVVTTIGHAFDRDGGGSHAVADHDLRLQTPLGEALDVLDIRVHQRMIHLFETRFVQAADPELAWPDVVLAADQVHGDGIVHPDHQACSHPTGEQHVDRTGGIFDRGEHTLHQMLAQEGPVVVGSNAFDHDTLNVLLRFDDAGFGGMDLDVRNAGYGVQRGIEGLVDRHARRFLGVGLLHGADLQVPPGAGYLRPHLPLKSLGDPQGQDHDRHAHHDAPHSDAHDRTRKPVPAVLVEQDAAGDEVCEAHGWRCIAAGGEDNERPCAAGGRKRL